MNSKMRLILKKNLRMKKISPKLRNKKISKTITRSLDSMSQMAHSQILMGKPLMIKITLMGMVMIPTGIMKQEWMTWSKGHGIVSSSKSGMLSISELLQYLGFYLVQHSSQLIS